MFYYAIIIISKYFPYCHKTYCMLAEAHSYLILLHKTVTFIHKYISNLLPIKFMSLRCRRRKKKKRKNKINGKPKRQKAGDVQHQLPKNENYIEHRHCVSFHHWTAISFPIAFYNILSFCHALCCCSIFPSVSFGRCVVCCMETTHIFQSDINPNFVLYDLSVVRRLLWEKGHVRSVPHINLISFHIFLIAIYCRCSDGDGVVYEP